MARHRLALVFGLLAAACAAPSDTGSQSAAAAATAAPLAETMYLALDQGDLATADALLVDWPADGLDSLLPTAHLLFAYRQTGEARYLDRLVTILRSLVAYDKIRTAPSDTFDVPHTTAYRAMMLVDLIVKLKSRGKLPADLETGLRGSAQRAAARLMDPTQFESTASQGFTEAAALLVLAYNLPDLAEASAWHATALRRLELMRTTMIDADGVDVQNSPEGHLLVLGLVTQIGAWAASFEPTISDVWETTKRAMTHYIAYVTQPDGKLPTLGATGVMTVPTQNALVYGQLATVDPEFAWVWSRGKDGRTPSKRVELFPTAGLFTLRATMAPATQAAQTFVTFDAGVYRTSRSHLDALSTTIYSEGAALVPDAGLYTYDPGNDFDYFHGTRSHNTVVVDGLDQAAGAARSGAYGVAGEAAWATGESTLYDGVTHRRTVVVLDQGIVLVTDDLVSDRDHAYRQTWHFFAGGDVALDGLDATVDNLKKTPIVLVRQADPAGLSVADTFGQTAPVQGWVSASYGKKDAVHALEYLRHATSASFGTLFVMGRHARSGNPASVTQSRDGATGDRLFTVCADETSTTVRIAHEGTIDAQVTTSAASCSSPRK